MKSIYKAIEQSLAEATLQQVVIPPIHMYVCFLLSYIMSMYMFSELHIDFLIRLSYLLELELFRISTY
jgi:hypothetical protein